MQPILQTDRLTLKPLASHYLEELFILDSNPEVMKFIRAETPSRADAQRKMDRYLAHATARPGLGAFALHLASTSEFVGFGFLVDIELNPLHKKVEVGYRLHQKFWGQGLASEVTRALLGYGFNSLNLPEIYGTTHRDHIVSQAVLRKCGLQKVGSAEYHQGCTVFVIKNPGSA